MNDLCVCGHAYVEHDIDDNGEPCEVVYCDCEGYDEDLPTDLPDAG